MAAIAVTNTMKEVKTVIVTATSNLGDHTWSPCTAGKTIREHLESLPFPATKMPMYEANIKAEAIVTTLGPSQTHVGEGKQDEILDLGSMISSSTFFFNHAATLLFNSTPDNDFESFAASIHAYSEAESIRCASFASDAQYWAYQREWQKLLHLFDASRAECLARGKHHCLGEYLWGDTFLQPLDELIELYGRFESSYNGAKGLEALLPANDFGLLSSPFPGTPSLLAAPVPQAVSIRESQQQQNEWPYVEGYTDYFHAAHAYGHLPLMRFDFPEKNFEEATSHFHPVSLCERMVPPPLNYSPELPQRQEQQSCSSSASSSSPPPGNCVGMYRPRLLHTVSVGHQRDLSVLSDSFSLDSDEKSSSDGPYSKLIASDKTPPPTGSAAKTAPWQQRCREQRKTKSKAYYEMRKQRRGLVTQALSQLLYTVEVLKSQGCAVTDVWHAVNSILAAKRDAKKTCGTLYAYLDGSPSSPLLSSSPGRDSEKKQRRKLHWEKQKDEEIHTFLKLSKLAALLTDILSNNSKDFPRPSSAKLDELDQLTRQSLLSAWLGLQPHWVELETSEARMTDKYDSKSIAALNALFRGSGGTAEAAASAV